MLHSLKEIRKTDSSAATAIFHDITVKNKISDYKVNKSDSSLSILDMSQKGAWLEPWMIKSEEIYTVLTGDRLFDTLYKEDSTSISNIKAMDIKEAQKELDIEFDKIDEPPVSLKLLICETAFNSIFDIDLKNKIVKLKEPSLSLKPIEQKGFYIPLSQEEIVMSSLKDYMDKTNSIFINLKNEKYIKNKVNKNPELN